jgi:MoxR-vWA-beta-propeller ternary system domain bpX2
MSAMSTTGFSNAPVTQDPWQSVSAARLPTSFLHVLAPIRNSSDIRVHVTGDIAWVVWPAGRTEVARRLLSVPGVELFVRREARWFRFRSRLPTAAAPPSGDGATLTALLLPARFEPIAPQNTALQSIEIRIVRGGQPKPATALTCLITDLGKWAETATTKELSAVKAARSGSRAVLLGAKLPPVPGAVRYWGDELMVPIGFRVVPDLPAGTIREAIGVATDEIALLDSSGAERIPRAAFETLTRAGLQLACREFTSDPTP